MKHMVAILGAAALSLVSGAVVGSAMPTEPLSSGKGLEDIAPPPIQRYRAAVQGTPDHYPLKTASGTVPVEELSMHGLYRDRYRPYQEAAFDPDEFEPSLVDMAEAAEPIEIDIDMAPLPETRFASTAGQYAERGARVIDVARELSQLR